MPPRERFLSPGEVCFARRQTYVDLAVLLTAIRQEMGNFALDFRREWSVCAGGKAVCLGWLIQLLAQTRNAVDSEIEQQIADIERSSVAELRALWITTFKKPAPKALSKDLLGRMLAWHIQEQAYGGHDRATLKILASQVKGARGGPGPRRLKLGTEIVREYQGQRHTVVITGAGYRWRDGDYPSLTAIARLITGTNWNGPRFFGLREAAQAPSGGGTLPRGLERKALGEARKNGRSAGP